MATRNKTTTKAAKPRPELACSGCGKPIKNSNRRKTTLCLKCLLKGKCPACGQIRGTVQHVCNSVDLRGPRYCTQCGRLLRNTGFERWTTQCAYCMKRRWRDKERLLRSALVAQFGGACQLCGYRRCSSALHFHHLNSSSKREYSKKGGTSLKEIRTHPERFQLVCANCHIELHDQARHADTQVNHHDQSK